MSNSMRHLAIICDGNRRWAAEHGLEGRMGHAAGLVAIERACEWAIDRLEYLTIFCFSTENWNRSTEEVDGLMTLARDYFSNRKDWYLERGIKVQAYGRRDRFPKDLLQCLDELEEITKACSRLTLTVCVDYGGRDEIVRAARTASLGELSEEGISRKLNMRFPDPEMIIRTGGMHRLSNFLLWQAAYSELYFTDVLFPALNWAELDKAMEWFEVQKRNFGR